MVCEGGALCRLRSTDVFRARSKQVPWRERPRDLTGVAGHVNQRALYAAIGDADSRLRKPVTLNHAIQRLMVLDAIVEDPDLVWLGTADEKAAHLLALTRIEEADLPHVSVGEGEARTVRYFPDRLPIGIHLAGRGVAVYVVTDQSLDDFRVFLERHAALVRALPACLLPARRDADGASVRSGRAEGDR